VGAVEEVGSRGQLFHRRAALCLQRVPQDSIPQPQRRGLVWPNSCPKKTDVALKTPKTLDYKRQVGRLTQQWMRRPAMHFPRLSCALRMISSCGATGPPHAALKSAAAGLQPCEARQVWHVQQARW
jgi:hypothetical protein